MSNVEGLQNLLNKLTNIGGNIENTLRIGILKGCNIIKTSAKVRVNVDTGELRNSIHTRTKVKSNEVIGETYTAVKHAPFYEFGTGPKGRDTYPYKIKGVTLRYKADKWRAKIPKVGWRYVSGQVAKPFMYPAFKENEEKVKEEIKNEVIKEIRKLGG